MVAAGARGEERTFTAGGTGNTGKAGLRVGEGMKNHVVSVICADYSSGSMPFWKIARVPGEPYTDSTLVLDSLAGAWVGRPWKSKCVFWPILVWLIFILVWPTWNPYA